MIHQQLAASHYRIKGYPTTPQWVEYRTVKHQILSGNIKPKTLVLREDRLDWQAASELVELEEFLELRKKLAPLKPRENFKWRWPRLRVLKWSSGLVGKFKKLIFTNKTSEKEDLMSWKVELIDGKLLCRREGLESKKIGLSDAESSRSGRWSDKFSNEDLTFSEWLSSIASTTSSQAGNLYLVRMRYAGELFLKMVTTLDLVEMDVVEQWSCPSKEIARGFRKEILRRFGDFCGAAPAEVDDYANTFSIQLESTLKESVEQMLMLLTAKMLVYQLGKKRINRDLVKRLIGDGGQSLILTYFNADQKRLTIHATVICMNGDFLRVCEVGDVNEIAKSIRLNKLIKVREG